MVYTLKPIYKWILTFWNKHIIAEFLHGIRDALNVWQPKLTEEELTEVKRLNKLYQTLTFLV